MEKIFVKPVEGKRCKDPATYELLPERGKKVPKNAYWLRRLKDGDCVLAEAAPKSEQPSKKKKKEEPKAEGDS